LKIIITYGTRRAFGFFGFLCLNKASNLFLLLSFDRLSKKDSYQLIGLFLILGSSKKNK